MLRAYANRLGDKVTFIAFDSDHFMLAKKSQEIQAAIESWLQQH